MENARDKKIPSACIGQWYDIHQGVNIRTGIEADSVPKIGNNVWIGPGTKIFGNVEMDANTMIGANAVVTKSFEKENCCIAGTPARIISFESNIYQHG